MLARSRDCLTMGQEVEIQEFPIRAGCPPTFLSGKGPLCPVRSEKWHPASACVPLIPKGQKRRRGGGSLYIRTHTFSTISYFF